MFYFSEKDGCIFISMRVVPNSSKTEFIKDIDRLRFKITAPPVDNKANKYIIEYFSKEFRLPKKNIKLIKGELSREKVIEISELDDSKKILIEDFFHNL